MTKSIYKDAIFFLGLSVATGLFQSVLYLVVGPDLVTQSSFANFFLFSNVVSFSASAFLLQSYYNQHLRMAFSTAFAALFTNFLRVTLLYCLLAPISRAFQQYYPVILILDLVTALLAAGSLVLSRSGENVWLKAAGLLSLLTTGISLAMILWTMQVHSSRTTPALEKWQLCLSFVASLQPLLLIGYFRQLRSIQSHTSDSSQPSEPANMMIAAKFLCLAAFLFFGTRLMDDGIRATRPQPQAIAQARLFEARTFTNQHGDTLSYRLLMPEGYDPTQSYPLVVSLHGGAGYGTDNIRQLASWEIQELTKLHNRQKYPAFIVAPQCSHGASWGGLPHLLTRDTIVLGLLNALKAEFTIDPNRLYLIGHSLGGYGTWYFIGTHPGVFAAAIPLSGGGDPALARNMVQTAIWAFHGALDKNVPIDGSRRIIEAIEHSGGHPRYTEFANVGHYLNPSLDATPGIFEWLFAQRRANLL